MVAALDYDPVVVSLREGEPARAAAAYWATANPRNVAGDELPWNWCRMPAGVTALEALTRAVSGEQVT